ncbi:GNAT family N-acetyltransferase [Saccharopolyspora erythraea]|uniref:GNAT family N-acetyltransferase n=1 Tax=Saccharopolyspora erythraea TaxID=1836 RepID=UPI001BA7E300|nr:GNAT family N-acetyltransferase [Saccharopolyspora erythraea]QUH04381.1 GNAT family N-acetyltransferase [Saccharopolyspora erythraea]
MGILVEAVDEAGGREFTVEVVDMRAYGAQERAEIIDGETDPSGIDDLNLVWRDKVGHVVLRDSDKLVAHAGWLPIEIRSRGQHVPAVGLGGVLVHRSLRGHHLGQMVVEAAMGRMRRTGRPIGLLFCRAALVPYYERLGWRALSSDITVDQPDGPVLMPLTTCWVPLVDGAQLTEGPLILDGLPF